MASHASLADALRLTRAGDLTGATALIRTLMAGGVPARATAGDVIDLVPTRTTITGPASPAPDAAAPGRFEARHHRGPAGEMSYMLYRPAAAAADMPLVVMLHGCGQTPEDFARGTGMNRLADEMGFLVAYPRQTAAANQGRCWNWFRPGDQARGLGEPALIAGIAAAVIADEHADAARVYVAGLSAGGAAAAIMADAYPELFAAVGIHSGLACGVARDLPGALAAMKRGGRAGPRAVAEGARFVPVITVHGDRDATVHEANAREIVAVATAATGVAVTVEVEHGEAAGRRFTCARSRDPNGRILIEQWTIAGAGHAWSGGDPTGSHADAAGPDASRAMLRFFLGHRK